MRKKITLLLLLFPLFAFCQKTIRITNKQTDEAYYVLKSDTSIRQGVYRKWSWDDKSKIEGYYKNGHEDSIWTFYDAKGKIEQTYDYTNKRILYQEDSTKGKSEKSLIIQGTDTIKAILDQSPVYIGGKTELRNSLNGYLRNQPTKCDTNGWVYIIFTIGVNGKAFNYKVVGQAHCLNMMILDAFKKISNEWVPGILNGEKVNVLHYQSFYFDNGFLYTYRIH